MSATQTDWIFWISAGVVGLGAAVLLGWSLFWDRARGRQRCPKCWYEMHSTPGTTCPECGHRIRDPRALGRTRRRWRWAIVAVLLAGVAVGLAETPRMRAKGWTSIIPSAALVTVWPLSVDEWIEDSFGRTRSGDDAIAELNKRIESGSLSRWEASWWVSRVEAALRRQGRMVTENELATADRIAHARLTRRFDRLRFDEVAGAIAKDLGVPIRIMWQALPPGRRGESALSFGIVRASGDEAIDAMAGAWNRPGFLEYPLEASLVGERGIEVSAIPDEVHATRSSIHDLAPLIDSLKKARMGAGFAAPTDADLAAAIGDGCMRLRPIRGTRGGLETLWQGSHRIGVGHLLVASAPVWELWEGASALDAIRRSVDAEGAGIHVVAADVPEWNEAVATLERLRNTMVEVDTDEMTVAEVLGRVENASGVPVVVDWSEISSWRGYKQDSKLPIGAGSYSAEELLDKVWQTTAAPVSGGVWWNVVHGAVRVQAWEGGYAPVRLYHVGDLVTAEMRAEGASFNDADAERRCFDRVQARMEGAVKIHASVNPAGGSVQACPAFGWRVLVWAGVADHLRIEGVLEGMRRELNKGAAVSGNPATSP